jgi:molybdate transport system permease protein
MLLGLPMAALLLRASPAAPGRLWGDRETRQAIRLSLATSTCAVVIAVAFGTPLAHRLARGRFRGRALLEVLVDLPTVLPPAVAGIALLMAFGSRGILGAALRRVGIELPNTPAAVVLAQTFVAAPYFINAATVGLAAVSEDLREAAALDGASPFQTFTLVTLPLAWRGMIGGAALCWARALGEFGATILFAGNMPGRTQTMPLAVYEGFQSDMHRALALAVVLLGISFALLLAIRATMRVHPDA